MNEYGELTAMQYIHPEWGGNATYEDNQTVFDVKITEDNLVYSLVGNVGDNKTNWGDGTEDMNIYHEYSKAGTYTIITENTQTFAQGTVVDSSISSPIVKFRALNKSLTNGSHLFDGWSNLLQVNKLTNTFNSYDYMFNNCSRLVNVDLSGCTFSHSAKDMSYMFNNCQRFTINPINIIPDSVTNITNLYNGTSITDLSGLTIGSGVTTYTNWKPNNLIIMDNAIIKNNVIKFAGDTKIKSIKNLSRPNTTDWSSYFEGCTSLLHDINFQSSTKNVTNCFKGCTSMTHIHSNWKNTYTSGITATGCYAGCVGIIYIDDIDIGVTEYHTALDDIPTTWGGFGFFKEYTGVYKLVIPSDGYTVTFGKLLDNKIVDWGDRTSSTGVLSHTYSKAGTYVVKGNIAPNSSESYGIDNNMRNVLTEVKQHPTTYIAGFNNCPNLKYINVRNCRLSSNFAKGATYLEYVDVTNCKCGDKWRNCAGTFQDCINLTDIVGLETLDFMAYAPKNIGGFFANCQNLKDSTIRKCETWNVGTPKEISAMFKQCTQLTSIDLSGWDLSNATKLGNLCRECSNLKYVTLNLTGVLKDMSYAFYAAYNLKSLK